MLLDQQTFSVNNNYHRALRIGVAGWVWLVGICLNNILTFSHELCNDYNTLFKILVI